jgi:hypothetical protein
MMGQPVKISDGLVADARATGEVVQRSIAGQIEFWARLGRSADLVLGGAEAMTLKKRGDAIPLSELLSTVDAPAGRQRLSQQLAGRPFPHYEGVPGQPDMLIRVEADGTRTVGRFVGRSFRPSVSGERKATKVRKTPATKLRRKV